MRCVPSRRDCASFRYRADAGGTNPRALCHRARREQVRRPRWVLRRRVVRSRQAFIRTEMQINKCHPFLSGYLWYGSRRTIVPARYNCSASTSLASSCGSVHGASERRVGARWSIPSESPYAPPITKAIVRPRSRVSCIQLENCSDDCPIPPGSHATTCASDGTTFDSRTPSRSRTRSAETDFAGSSRTSCTSSGQ